MKVCRKCGVERPLSDFYKHSHMADGHLNICKECTKARVTRYRENNLEKIRWYDRKRGSRQSADDIREYRKSNPEKYEAHCKVKNAIRNNRLHKSTCIVCGGANSVAHHTDYNNQLDVVWMCKEHHARLHKYMRDFGITIYTFLCVF